MMIRIKDFDMILPMMTPKNMPPIPKKKYPPTFHFAVVCIPVVRKIGITYSVNLIFSVLKIYLHVFLFRQIQIYQKRVSFSLFLASFCAPCRFLLP